MRILVPLDSAAASLGAHEVADALAREAAARGRDVTIVRTGSYGMHWLEPLIDVGGVGFGPLSPADVPSLFDAGFAAHPLNIGRIDNHPFMAAQRRMLFARCGRTDPLSRNEYLASEGWKGLAIARALGPEKLIEAVTASGLRGRGGAGFPTGIKWKTVADAPGDIKYVVCNADEGDSGTFSDRMIMEGDPFGVIEGMAIAGLATGARRGYIYIRSEYPIAIHVMRQAIERARAAGDLGVHFDIELRVGAGAYVCGEETALLESLEGKRGLVRAKPPLPAVHGLFGKPTVVNNVISFASIPAILVRGPDHYAQLGFGRSRGTIPIQLAGNVRHAGLFEAPFGMTLGDLVMKIGGGTRSGRPVRAVQVGGPLGAYFPTSLFETPFDYESFAAKGGLIGHAGIVVFDDTVDLARQARFAMEFCAIESCGKCTPCRIGSVRGVEVIDRILAGNSGPGSARSQRALLEDLCSTMRQGSLCALGGFVPYPVISALTHFPEDFGVRPR